MLTWHAVDVDFAALRAFTSAPTAATPWRSCRQAVPSWATVNTRLREVSAGLGLLHSAAMASALRVASRLPRPCARAALRVSCAPATPLCATRSLLTQQPPTSRFAPGIFPASRALLPRAAMGGAFSRAARVGAAADPGASEAQTEHTLMQNKAQQQDAANKFHMTPVDAKALASACARTPSHAHCAAR